MVGTTVSHYRIVERLGSGGMGVVYKAEDLRLKRTVALKFLPPDLTNDREARARLCCEAQAASALQHRNICTVHDIDQTSDGQMFLVMDFYEGVTLDRKIARAPLPLAEARTIAAQIAEGIAEAHRQGIIHRDIKPSNIMLTARDEVKILDFGLTRLSGQSLATLPGTTLGTVAYMSPEQARGEPVDNRTDIWSFGVVLYEMLAGVRPFSAAYPVAVLYAILNLEPEALSRLRPDVPEDLASLVGHCLQKDRERRPSALHGLTLTPEASPKTRPRIAPFLRRIPRPLQWALASVTILLISLLTYLLMAARSISLKPEDSVVVADFDNRTGEHFLDHSLTQAVRVSLRQSAQFIVLSRERIAEALELLQMKNLRAVDESAALAVARREGARAVVSGGVDRIGSAFVLSCNVLDAGTGETVALLREEAPKAETCLGAIDRLCEGLRRKLGESMSRISEAHRPLQDVTTSSLQALELYSQAVTFESQGKYQEAAIANRQAVAIDSQFVQAISDLAYQYRKLGNDTLAAAFHARVLPLLDHVTERERLEILADYYGPAFENDFPKAFQYARELTVRYPNDAYAFASLGHLAMTVGDANAALEANGKAVAMYPEYAKTCLNNSAYALALNDRGTEALTYFRKARELRPDYSAITTYMGMVYWLEGRLDSAEVELNLPLSADDPSQRIQRRVVRAALDYFQGRLAAARDTLEAAAAECRRLGRTPDEAFLRSFRAEVFAAAGDPNRYAGEMEAAVRLAASPYYELLLAGRSYARHGMLPRTEEIIRRISGTESLDPLFVRRRPAFIALLSGELSLARRNPGQARRYFEAVEPLRAGDPVFLLAREGVAECSEQTADTAAITLLKDLLSHRGETIMGYLSSTRQSGFWPRLLLPETYLKIAEGYIRARQPAPARRYLDSALSCWKDADPSDLRALQARTLGQRLGLKQ